MREDNNNRVCPVEMAGGLDNRIRKFLQNPRKILRNYVREGLTVLDVGCGPGVFSVEMANMIGVSGQVIAADLQEGMLQKLADKIKGTDLENRIELLKCETDRIGITENVDFVLAFYMVHEVPDHEGFFREIRELLKPDGRVLIVEPNFHVSKKAFAEMINLTEKLGFKVIERPKVFFSRAVTLGVA